MLTKALDWVTQHPESILSTRDAWNAEFKVRHGARRRARITFEAVHHSLEQWFVDPVRSIGEAKRKDRASAFTFPFCSSCLLSEKRGRIESKRVVRLQTSDLDQRTGVLVRDQRIRVRWSKHGTHRCCTIAEYGCGHAPRRGYLTGAQ